MSKFRIENVDRKRGRFLCRSGRRAILQLAEALDGNEIGDLDKLPTPVNFKEFEVNKISFPADGKTVPALEVKTADSDVVTYTVVRSKAGLSLYARVHEPPYSHPPLYHFGLDVFEEQPKPKKSDVSKVLPKDVNLNQDFKVADVVRKGN
ncbi:MAG: hypothetical protein V1921_03140 [Candidatus Altiarchaeota archaeon]